VLVHGRLVLIRHSGVRRNDNSKIKIDFSLNP